MDRDRDHQIVYHCVEEDTCDKTSRNNRRNNSESENEKYCHKNGDKLGKLKSDVTYLIAAVLNTPYMGSTISLV